MPRKLRPGDVLFRFLPEYQVWHTGIIIEAPEQHCDSINLMEFDDSNNVAKVTLRNYLWFRKYFWVARFQDEMEKFGHSVFRTLEERIQTAKDLYADNSLTYTLNRYNCEYFVRRCVFKDPLLWASNQTMVLSNSRLALYSKLATIFIFNIIHKFNDDLEYEQDKLKYEYKYQCNDNGRIAYRSTRRYIE